MNINVPESARDHFWDDPPEGSWEFWGFKFKPPCKVGELLNFRIDGKIVATAVVARIEPPGQSQCDGTGRFMRSWKVFWSPESFKDLRPVHS